MRAAAVALALLACSPHHAPPAPPPAALVDPALELLVTPAPDHHAFIAALDGAQHSIDLAMFHLTDPAVIDALVRAVQRGVAVRVIVDDARRVTPALGDHVRAPSRAFSIMHEKAMVVDGSVAFVTAINLTREVASTRDFGVVTRVPSVVSAVAQLFAADWDNAATGGQATPALDPALVVSPGARTKLVALVDAAAHDVIATVENLGDPAIAEALIAAHQRGASVRLIVPLCDRNADPLYDLAPARRLAAAGVAVHMASEPYMHSKMIQIDGGAATYVGSANFSINSLTKARELGVIFANPPAAKTIAAAFEADWASSAPPPENQPDCENAATSDPGSGV